MQTKAKEKSVLIQGYGGRMMDDIKLVSFHFKSFNSLNLEEARLFYIDIAESYLNLINEKKELRPFLYNYPFDWRNLDLIISFYDKTSLLRQKESIALMFHKTDSGNLYYKFHDFETDKFLTIHQETYEEALKIVKETGILDPKPEALVDNKVPHKKKRRSNRKLSLTEKKLLNI